MLWCQDLRPLGMTSSLRCKGLLQRVEILKESGVPNRMLVPRQPIPIAGGILSYRSVPKRRGSSSVRFSNTV
jgi:hypothetical protein